MERSSLSSPQAENPKKSGKTLALFSPEIRLSEVRVSAMMPQTSQNFQRRGRPARQASRILVKELRKEGWSYRRIAKAMGLGYGTVRRVATGTGAHRYNFT